MKRIKLRGKYSFLETLVDDDIYDYLKSNKIHLCGNPYPSGSTYRVYAYNDKLSKIQLHRLIFELKTGTCPKIVDHLDNNALNNQFSNLRVSDYQDNREKAPILFRHSKSGYHGVSRYYSRGHNLYKLGIWREGKTYPLVTSTDKEFLAAIYDFIYRDILKVVNYQDQVSLKVDLIYIESRVSHIEFQRVLNFINKFRKA